MKDINDFINSITKYQKKSKDELREIYDISLSFILSQKSKTLLSLNKEQTKQIIDWLNKHSLPLYEEVEDYEQCKRIKDLSDILKQLKNLES